MPVDAPGAQAVRPAARSLGRATPTRDDGARYFFSVNVRELLSQTTFPSLSVFVVL